MPLPLPQLDDRTYADLVAETRALVAATPGGWSDHNASDPGITLLELFAWIAEMLLYRADQVTERHRIAFLRLLNGPGWEPDGRPLEAQIADALSAFRTPYRAVTAADWERHASAVAGVARVRCVPRRHVASDPDADRPGELSVIIVPEAASSSLVVEASGTQQPWRPGLALLGGASTFLYVGATSPFTRVEFRFAEPGGSLSLAFQYRRASGWASLAVDDATQGWAVDGAVSFVRPADWTAGSVGASQPLFWIRVSSTTPATSPARATRIRPRPLALPGEALTAAVWAYLDPRRVLTTRHHVVAPIFAPVSAEILVRGREDVPPADVRVAVEDALSDFLDVHTGGPEGDGWPIGRDVFVSELYERLDRLPVVDYVPQIALASACAPGEAGCVPAERLWHDNGDEIGLALRPHQLPDARIAPWSIVVAERFVTLVVDVAVKRRPAATAAETARAVKEALRLEYHPAHGGPTGAAAWSQKRAAVTSLVAGLGQVASVEALRLEAEPAERLALDAQGLPELRVEAGELVDPYLQVEVSG